jgi:putative FmdB family regulatory protein
MPIYAYKCESCGHRQDVLQRISDAPLGTCPACGEPRFVKQLTAAGFQLKGSGWYATDFRGGANAPANGDDKPDAGDSKAAADKAPAKGEADTAPAGKSESKTSDKAAAAPADKPSGKPAEPA